MRAHCSYLYWWWRGTCATDLGSEN